MKNLLLGCVAMAALIGQAQAYTISQSSTLPGGPYTSPIPDSSTPDVFTDRTTSDPGVYKSPFEGTSAYGSLFTSIEGNGTATFNATGNQLSLIWGSPDTYNQLSFYSGANAGGDLLGTVTGSSINPANGTGFSYVTIGGLDTFGSFKLINNPGTNAFEVSTFNVSSVPLPAGLPMFGGALLCLGGLALLRRGRKAVAAAAV